MKHKSIGTELSQAEFESEDLHAPIPTKLPEKTDIKVSGVATAAGIAFVALRGWLENN